MVHIHSLQFSSDDHYLLVGAHSGGLYSLEISTGEETRFDLSTALHDSEWIMPYASRDGSTVVSRSSKKICLWDYTTRTPVMCWSAIDCGLVTWALSTLAFTSTGKLFLAWGCKDVVRVSNISTFLFMPPDADQSFMDEMSDRMREWKKLLQESITFSVGDSRLVKSVRISRDGRLALVVSTNHSTVSALMVRTSAVTDPPLRC